MSEQPFHQSVRPRRTTQPPVYLRDYEVQYPMQHSPVPEGVPQQSVRTHQSEILPPDSPLSSSHDYSTGAAAGVMITPHSRTNAGRQPDRRWPTAPHYESDEEEDQEDEASLTAVRHRLEVQDLKQENRQLREAQLVLKEEIQQLQNLHKGMQDLIM